MAVEFNVTPADKFFLGEDKVIDFEITGLDGVTPLEMTAVPVEWSLRKTDKAADPAILLKTLTDGITLIGDFSFDRAVNTQRVRITFVPADTVALKPNFPYRHSLKRLDVGNRNILSYGSFTLLQATEH